MSSDIRTGVKTKEEYIEAASISYVPSILALNKRQAYALDINKITFKELNVESDSVVPSFLTSEMTEINTAKVSQKSHIFYSYGKGIKFRRDLLQNANVNIQPLHDQIIRQLSIQWDKNALVGEGGNNGLITSTDANYLTPSSAEIPAISGDGFNQVLKAKQVAVALNNLVNDYTASTDLVVYFYGSTLLSFLGNITAGQENDVRFHIRQAFEGKNVKFVDISALAAPAGLSLGNGIVVVANDLTTLEHCGLPQIKNQGVNDEDDYYWARYFFGSVQVRPTVLGAVIKQAITFA